MATPCFLHRCLLSAPESPDSTGNEDEGKQGEHDGQCRAKRPVAGGKELVLYDVAHESRFRSAHDVGDDKHAEGRNENQYRPCRNAGHRQRQGDFSKGCHGRSAQISSCFQEPAVELFDGDINGEDHKRKKGVHHAQHDSAFIVQELDRLGNNFQLHQNRIQHALAAEDDHPRIGADKEIDPERNHTEDQSLLPQMAGEPGDAVCQRIAHEDGAYRGYDGYENCPSKNGNIKRIQKSCIVLESPVKKRSVRTPCGKRKKPLPR